MNWELIGHMKYLITNIIWFGFCLILLSYCTTSIKTIKKNPVKFNNRNISIKGRVISSLDLKDLNCFTLRNQSGNILVVTANLLPLENDKIRVKGTIDYQYVYKNQTLLVLKEKKLKPQKSPASKKLQEKL
jgi:hypothetical protein